MTFFALDKGRRPLNILFYFFGNEDLALNTEYTYINIEVAGTNSVNSWVPLECPFPCMLVRLFMRSCIQAGVKPSNKENTNMPPGFLLSMWENS